MPYDSSLAMHIAFGMTFGTSKLCKYCMQHVYIWCPGAAIGQVTNCFSRSYTFETRTVSTTFVTSKSESYRIQNLQIFSFKIIQHFGSRYRQIHRISQLGSLIYCYMTSMPSVWAFRAEFISIVAEK